MSYYYLGYRRDIESYLLSLWRYEKYNNMENFIGLEWNKNKKGIVDSIPWQKKFIRSSYKKKFDIMVL